MCEITLIEIKSPHTNNYQLKKRATLEILFCLQNFCMTAANSRSAPNSCATKSCFHIYGDDKTFIYIKIIKASSQLFSVALSNRQDSSLVTFCNQETSPLPCRILGFQSQGNTD